MNRLALALQEIRLARRHTLLVLDHTDPARWFETPSGVSNVAWQLGHLTVAAHTLALVRLRGERDADRRLFDLAFHYERYGKGTTPDPDPAGQPTPDQLRAAYDRVHARIQDEIAAFPEDRLDEPPERPHPFFDTKYGALAWCARHEMMHAGQIALIRRLWGLPPFR